jgi:hypothetical protein
MWFAVRVIICLLTIQLLVCVSEVSGRSGRRSKRKRHGSSASHGIPLTAPVDPLFTDQREIRLPFAKVSYTNLNHFRFVILMFKFR